MKSLNEAYQKSKSDPMVFHYWCNSLGEINPPDDPQRRGTPADLPDAARIIYQNLYEDDRCGVRNYVVTVEHKTGVALCWLIDEDDQKIPFADVRRAAAVLESIVPYGTVYVGENTEPEGHEILLFIPDDKIRLFYNSLPKRDIEFGEKVYSLIYDIPKLSEAYYATVRWMVDDVISAAKEDGVTLTKQQAVIWWKENEKTFAEALTQTGNEMLVDVDWASVAAKGELK